MRGINRRYNKKRYRGLISQVELSRLPLTRREETFFLYRFGTSLSLSILNPPTHNQRKSDPPRARYIKTVITGMRSFIALRRQKRRGPRANRKLGVALGILELADKRAVRSSCAPLSLVRFLPAFSVTSSSIAPNSSFLLSSVPRMPHANMDDLRRFFAFLLILRFTTPFVPRASDVL